MAVVTEPRLTREYWVVTNHPETSQGERGYIGHVCDGSLIGGGKHDMVLARDSTREQLSHDVGHPYLCRTSLARCGEGVARCGRKKMCRTCSEVAKRQKRSSCAREKLPRTFFSRHVQFEVGHRKVAEWHNISCSARVRSADTLGRAKWCCKPHRVQLRVGARSPRTVALAR